LELFHTQIEFVPANKVGIDFVTFIVFGTMIILNLFIGLIMNRMSEMHAEIAECDRAKHETETARRRWKTNSSRSMRN